MSRETTPAHRRTAVALRYDGVGAPRVTAKGHGAVADRIMEIAAAHGIPYREDPALATVLAHIELGDEIPTVLYQAIAEVLAFAFSLSGREPPSASGR